MFRLLKLPHLQHRRVNMLQLNPYQQGHLMTYPLQIHLLLILVLNTLKYHFHKKISDLVSIIALTSI